MTSSTSAARIATLRAEALRGLDTSASSSANAANNTAAPSAADVEATRAREAAVSALIDALVAEGDASALAALFDEFKPLFAALPKAKTAKLVRGVIEAIAKVPGSEELQVRKGKEKEKKLFLIRFKIDREKETSMRAPNEKRKKTQPRTSSLFHTPLPPLFTSSSASARSRPPGPARRSAPSSASASTPASQVCSCAPGTSPAL